MKLFSQSVRCAPSYSSSLTRTHVAAGLACATLVLCAAPGSAQTPSSGARDLPAKAIPVPDTVSPQMQKLIGAPLSPTWNVIPKTADEWKAQVNAGYEATMKTLPALREALKVKVEPTTLDGVKAYMVTPESIAAAEPQSPAGPRARRLLRQLPG